MRRDGLPSSSERNFGGDPVVYHVIDLSPVDPGPEAFLAHPFSFFCLSSFLPASGCSRRAKSQW